MSATRDVSSDLGALIHQLLASYRPTPGVYDELLDENGAVRPAWRAILEFFARLSDAERRSAQDLAQRLLRENGVTFVAQDDDQSTRRPWQFDLFPLLISAEEWRSLETGLIQRARLLNAILVDLYGSQRVLKEGVLPSSMVFGNLHFLPPCSGIGARAEHQLHFLAFDIARSPDGRWWVLSDRAEAPSGAGYALENRVVSSRCLPEPFASQNVRRHASFFRDFNDHFLSLAGRETPLAVFLSRGPSKQTYFEHAYLARYLGYNIVEGSDLTVRGDRVFLKSVAGLRKVDLILRTVRSELCDPLELRSDSLNGVPGLLQTVRAGKVTIGNALGSGLVESDAFLSFLPTLSRFYLSEELAMPSVATWWCGQSAERDYVLANLDQLIVRRISSTRSMLSGGQDGRVGKELSVEKRDRLTEMIRYRGHDFVGQERLSLSTAPVLDENALRPAPVVLRMYVAATGKGYRVLPGGLTRVSVGSNPQAAWLAAGDFSKDTWVLSDEPVETFSLFAQRHDQARISRGGRDLPSRAADHLFWLGRYAERAEAAVRLLRSLVIRLHGETGGHRSLFSPERLVDLLVVQKHLSARRGRRAIQAGRDAVEREFWTILFDPESKDGLATVLGNVRRTADVVRERLSFDAFRVLTDLTNILPALSHSPTHRFEDALRLSNRLIQHLAAFSGMVMENMTRGYGWRFLDMGRRIERVRALIALIQQLARRGEPEEDGALELLLELADSSMTYRARYHSPPQLTGVLDLLLADESNPRAVVFQINSLETHLNALPRPNDDGQLSAEQRILTRLNSDLRLADVHKLGSTVNRAGSRVRLDRLARQVEGGIKELSDHVSQHFFSHSAPERISSRRARGES